MHEITCKLHELITPARELETHNEAESKHQAESLSIKGRAVVLLKKTNFLREFPRVDFYTKH
jgi:hypothetical protein